MSAKENRFSVPMIPYEGKAEGATNTYAVMRVDVDNTHAATALPAAWRGRLVRFNVLTAATTVDIALAERSDAEVDSTVTVANTSSQTKVGMRLAAGTPVVLALPSWDVVENRYLIAEASAANTLLEVMVVE